MSSDDEVSLSSLLCSKPSTSKKNVSNTPVHLKGCATKLSLKWNSASIAVKQKENVDPCLLKTPENAKPKQISAAFLFSSTKKRKSVVCNQPELLPGHSILVGESSDEEEEFIINGSHQRFQSCIDHTTETEDAITDSPLVEYSMIRKWLQNNGDSPSEDDEDEDSFQDCQNKLGDSSLMATVKKKSEEKKLVVNSPLSFPKLSEKPLAPEGILADETVILSSDEDEADFKIAVVNKPDNLIINRLLNLKTTETKTVVSSSCPSSSFSDDDDFDSSFVTKPSLKDRLLNIPKTTPPHVKPPAPDVYDNMKEDDDDSPLVLRPPTKARFVLLSSDSSSDEASPALKGRKKHTKHTTRPTNKKSGSCSDLEDIFDTLTVNDEIDVKAKTTGKPKKTKTVVPAPTPKTINRWVEAPLYQNKRQKSFLASLSSDVDPALRHPDAHSYINNFRKLRDELTQRLFVVFNENIFKQQLPHDFPITWNARLTRTAGYCRNFIRKEGGVSTFECRIELSVKVLDSPCRLRDTLIHELCHAATWMIDQCRGGHGPIWKKWANYATRIYPELPPISRCHNYEIACKYYYNCTVCPFSTGRHSKSVDTATHVCPRCRGKLQLSTEPPTPKYGNQEEKTPKTTAKPPRTPNAFALFVKQHYATVKASRTDLPHSAVMKILSTKFAESKNNQSSV